MHSKSNTIILVAKTKTGKLIMGADRRSTYDYSQALEMPIPKIAFRNNVLLGATGDTWLCYLIVHVLKFADPTKDNIDPDIFIHYHFLKEIRKELLDHKYGDEHKLLKLPGDTFCEVVIGFSGRVYSIYIYNAAPENEHTIGSIIAEPVSLPYATGCGGLVALGAIDESSDLYKFDEKMQSFRLLTIKERIERAIRRACKVSPGCGLPLDILPRGIK